MKDDAEGFVWHRKAAEGGYDKAQSELAFSYLNGRGTKKDVLKGIECYRKAAAQGNSYAQLQLGRIYLNGEGTPKNEALALQFYLEAAKNGESYAYSKLAQIYMNGTDASKNAKEAVKWYRKAAEQGNAFAQFSIGVCYHNGEGVTKNESKAVEWFRKAAEQGYASAQINLGACYSNGEGVVKNEVEGYKWTLLAAAQGEETAKENVSVDERRLSPAQRAEGQRLAQEWEAAHAKREAVHEAEGRPVAVAAGDEPEDHGHRILDHPQRLPGDQSPRRQGHQQSARPDRRRSVGCSGGPRGCRLGLGVAQSERCLRCAARREQSHRTLGRDGGDCRLSQHRPSGLRAEAFERQHFEPRRDSGRREIFPSACPSNRETRAAPWSISTAMSSASSPRS